MGKTSFNFLTKIFSIILIILCLSYENISKAADECSDTADLVFVIDTSPSMEDEWNSVCSSIATIIADMKARGSVVNYKIYGIWEARDCATESIQIDTGGDATGRAGNNENWGPATSWLAKNYPWTAGAKRIVIPMSDECPYGGDDPCDSQDSASITAAIADAKANNMIVSPIITSDSGAEALSYGSQLASGTGGTLTGSPGTISPDQVVKAITDLLISILADKDKDGHVSVLCGGDDCNDNDPKIYPGTPCPSQCLDDSYMNRVCKDTGKCENSTPVFTCNTPANICETAKGKCVINNGNPTCTYPHTDANCTSPGFCQEGNGTCFISSDGQTKCAYGTSRKDCDADGDQCTVDTCKSNADGLSASCKAGNNVCGGMVPCGRLVDNPTTHNNDESRACGLCDIAMVINTIVLYLIGIVSLVALLALVIASYFYITSGGNPVQRNIAHDYLINIIKGYAVVFLAWLLVDFVLSAWGFISPLGGQWNVICLLSML